MIFSDWTSDVFSSYLALHRLVTNQLFRHHRDRLRHVAQRRVGLGCRAGALRVVATVAFAAHFHGVQIGWRMLQCIGGRVGIRSEEHTSELQSLMRISYAVFCLKKKITKTYNHTIENRYNTQESQ